MRAKIGIAFVVAASLVFGLAGPETADAVEVDSAFSDDDWSIHETAINAIAEVGITKGCNPPLNTRFCPLRSVTRGEMAAFLVRAFDLTGPSTAPFVDSVDHLFEADIAKLAANGITVGCGSPAEMRYCPDSPVSRAEMATFLLRALGLQPVADGPFVDVGGSVHLTSINAIAAQGITLGCNPPANNRYCPSDPVTRDQMATFLKRSLDLPDVLNRVAIRESVSCNEELTTCSSSVAIPAGRSFIVAEGWYQALPASAAEMAVFESAATDFEVTLDGVVLATDLVESSDGALAERRWETTVVNIGPGIHTMVGTWTWDGDVNLIATVTITSN